MKILLLFGIFSLFSQTSQCATIKGEIYLKLPKQISSAQITFKLKEAKSTIIKPVIATQVKLVKNNQNKPFDLSYNLKSILPDKHYFVEIIVIDPENNKILSQDLFPVLTFGHHNKLNIKINIPPPPIESQKNISSFQLVF